MEEKKPMITKSRLKSERGWTDKLLKIFLPIPDLTKQNPNYRSGPPMLLYYIDRVERIEDTEEFKSEKSRTSKRQVSANKAVETKMQQLREWVENIEINVPNCESSKLVKQACDHYNEIQNWRKSEGRSTCGRYASPDSDPKFIERICVNYLRHCLTRYEEHLDEISGKVGFSDGYDKIRNKILSKISQVHPWLSQECERQKEKTSNQ